MAADDLAQRIADFRAEQQARQAADTLAGDQAAAFDDVVDTLADLEDALMDLPGTTYPTMAEFDAVVAAAGALNWSFSY